MGTDITEQSIAPTIVSILSGNGSVLTAEFPIGAPVQDDLLIVARILERSPDLHTLILIRPWDLSHETGGVERVLNLGLEIAGKMLDGHRLDDIEKTINKRYKEPEYRFNVYLAMLIPGKFAPGLKSDRNSIYIVPRGGEKIEQEKEILVELGKPYRYSMLEWTANLGISVVIGLTLGRIFRRRKYISKTLLLNEIGKSVSAATGDASYPWIASSSEKIMNMLIDSGILHEEEHGASVYVTIDPSVLPMQVSAALENTGNIIDVTIS